MSLDFDVSIESEPEIDPQEDADSEDIKSIFKKKYKQIHQESASLKKHKYITYSDSTADFSKIAIGLGSEMQVYDVTPTGLSKYVGKNEFGTLDSPCTGVKFLKDDSNMIFASSSAGEIHMYDLRTFSKVYTFEDDTEILTKPVSCFDINSNSRMICAGTDELNQDVYLLFFDIRERRLMGAFFESHKEVVTDVKFHPSDPDTLATGSTDGLINIFDVSQQSEDDAMKYCLNTEDSVGKLSWHRNDKLSCITNTNNLQLFDVKEQDLIKKWEREEVTKAIKRKSVIDCHIVDCYEKGSDELIFLATSNYNKGECIRTAKFNEKTIEPIADFSGNNQIIRSSLYNEKENYFFTFGESSIISLWKEGDEGSALSSSSALKEDSSIKKKLKKKSNPY